MAKINSGGPVIYGLTPEDIEKIRKDNKFFDIFAEDPIKSESSTRIQNKQTQLNNMLKYNDKNIINFILNKSYNNIDSYKIGTLDINHTDFKKFSFVHLGINTNNLKETVLDKMKTQIRRQNFKLDYKDLVNNQFELLMRSNNGINRTDLAEKLNNFGLLTNPIQSVSSYITPTSIPFSTQPAFTGTPYASVSSFMTPTSTSSSNTVADASQSISNPTSSITLSNDQFKTLLINLIEGDWTNNSAIAGSAETVRNEIFKEFIKGYEANEYGTKPLSVQGPTGTHFEYIYNADVFARTGHSEVDRGPDWKLEDFVNIIEPVTDHKAKHIFKFAPYINYDSNKDLKSIEISHYFPISRYGDNALFGTPQDIIDFPPGMAGKIRTFSQIQVKQLAIKNKWLGPDNYSVLKYNDQNELHAKYVAESALSRTSLPKVQYFKIDYKDLINLDTNIIGTVFSDQARINLINELSTKNYDFSNISGVQRGGQNISSISFMKALPPEIIPVMMGGSGGSTSIKASVTQVKQDNSSDDEDSSATGQQSAAAPLDMSAIGDSAASAITEATGIVVPPPAVSEPEKQTVVVEKVVPNPNFGTFENILNTSEDNKCDVAFFYLKNHFINNSNNLDNFNVNVKYIKTQSNNIHIFETSSNSNKQFNFEIPNNSDDKIKIDIIPHNITGTLSALTGTQSAISDLNIERGHYIKINNFMMKVSQKDNNNKLIINTNKICEKRNNKYLKLQKSGHNNFNKGIILYLKVGLTNSKYFSSPIYFDIPVSKKVTRVVKKSPEIGKYYNVSFTVDNSSDNTSKLRIFKTADSCTLGMMFSSKFKNEMRSFPNIIYNITIIKDDVTLKFTLTSTSPTSKYFEIKNIKKKGRIPNLNFKMPKISAEDCEYNINN